MVGYTLGRRRHPPKPVLEKALSTASVNTAATESTVSSSAASSIASPPRGISSSSPSFGHCCTEDLTVSSSGHPSAGSSSPGHGSPTSTVSSSSSSSSSHPSSLRSGAASSKSRERSLRGHGHKTNGHRTSSKSSRPASAPSSTTTAVATPPPPPHIAAAAAPTHVAPSPPAAAATASRVGGVSLQLPQLDHDDYDMLGALKASLVDAPPPSHVMSSPPAPAETHDSTSGAGLSAESVGGASVRRNWLGHGVTSDGGCGGSGGCGGKACDGRGGGGGGSGTHNGGHGVSETDSLLPPAEGLSVLPAEISNPLIDPSSSLSSADGGSTGTPATTTTTTSYGTMTLCSDHPSPTHTDTRERRGRGFLAWLCAVLCCMTALVIVPWRLMRRRQNCARDAFSTHTDTQADSGADDDECLDETMESRARDGSGNEGLMGAPRSDGSCSEEDEDVVGLRERGCGRHGTGDSCRVGDQAAFAVVHEECAGGTEGVTGEVRRFGTDSGGGESVAAAVGVQEGNDREAQARKGDAKACEITVLALRMFAGQKDLQVETLSAVWALAWAAEHNCRVLAEAGAGELCVSAVRRSAGDAQVCYNALGALSALTHDAHTPARLRKVDGSCGVLVRCVYIHKRNAPIVDVGLRVLNNLAADVASRDALIGANVADVVIVALRMHTRQRSVVHGALALMNNLLSLSDLNTTTTNSNNNRNRDANNSTSSTESPHAAACHTGSFSLSERLMKSVCACASRMGGQIGCESLCAAMRAFDRDAEISEMGCVVVVGVCVWGGKGVRKRMGEEGVAHLLLGAVRRWSDVRDTRARTQTSAHTAAARAGLCACGMDKEPCVSRSDTRTLMAAMRALTCVCVEEENARDVSEHGACEEAAGVLSAHTRVCAQKSDPHTHTHLHTYTQMCAVHTDGRHSVDVQVLGCWLLGLLARGGSEARRRYRKAGAPDVCVRVLEGCVWAREGDSGVCASGGATEQPTHDAPALSLCDTPTEIYTHTHMDVHRLVCRALWCVVCVCRGCHDSKWAMGEAGACGAVVKVLRAFEGDADVQKLGYDAIRHLLGNGNNNRWLREAEPDELMAAALEAAQVHAELKSRDDDAWRTKPLRPITRASPPAECITA